MENLSVFLTISYLVSSLGDGAQSPSFSLHDDMTDLILLIQSLYAEIRSLPLASALAQNSVTKGDLAFGYASFFIASIPSLTFLSLPVPLESLLPTERTSSIPLPLNLMIVKVQSALFILMQNWPSLNSAQLLHHWETFACMLCMI